MVSKCEANALREKLNGKYEMDAGILIIRKYKIEDIVSVIALGRIII